MSLLPSLSSIRSGWASLFPSFPFHLPSFPSLLKGGWQRQKMVASKCAFHVAAVVGVTGQAEASTISSVWLLLWTSWIVAMEGSGPSRWDTSGYRQKQLNIKSRNSPPIPNSPQQRGASPLINANLVVSDGMLMTDCATTYSYQATSFTNHF